MPTGFSIVEEFYSNSNLTVLFQWDEPQGEGVQAIVDNYTIDISPRPLYPSEYSIVLPNSPQSLNVTINYNTNYTATIIAENCAGPSQPFNYPNISEYGMRVIGFDSNLICFFAIIVNCYDPMPPMNGSVSILDHTRKGGGVEYRCDDGFRPSATFRSTCTSTAMWDPLPQSLNCTFVRGKNDFY